MERAVVQRMNPAAEFDGWVPMRVGWEQGDPQVEWVRLGGERFIDPFFDDTIQRVLQHPFHQAFRRRTRLDEISEWRGRPAIAPRGFIFHMSRCGSTLVSQVLAA